MAKIAVLGYGTVGSGVVEILDANAESISKKAGQPIEVKSVLDLRDFPGDPIQEKICLLYTSPSPRDTERSRMPSSA